MFGLAVVIAVMMSRSWTVNVFQAFTPTWYQKLGYGPEFYGPLATTLVLASAVGTVGCGTLADRFGQKAMLVSSHILSPPLLLVYVLAGGTVGAISVCLAGAVLVSTFSVTTVLSQEYLPTKLAMASGMSVGLAMGLGGIAAVLLGAIADAVDLRTALLVTAVVPALGGVFAFWLPGRRELRARPVLAD